MREERIVIEGRELLIVRPDDPESLIDEKRFEEDEFMPYWAELWPSGLALADYVATLDLAGLRVLEVGCGLALPSFAAALSRAEVLATDWAPTALELVALNASANGIDLATALLDWRVTPTSVGTFDHVLAADVLYEKRNAAPLLALLTTVVADGGEVLVADPGRRHAAAFFEEASRDGWEVETVSTTTLPNGGISKLRRG
jgi:predicted nicotinamide N-methyase